MWHPSGIRPSALTKPLVAWSNDAPDFERAWLRGCFQPLAGILTMTSIPAAARDVCVVAGVTLVAALAAVGQVARPCLEVEIQGVGDDGRGARGEDEGSKSHASLDGCDFAIPRPKFHDITSPHLVCCSILPVK